MTATPNDESYCRVFLPESYLKALDAQIEKEGYLTLDAIRGFLSQNGVRDSASAEAFASLDPEVLIQIDIRTNYSVFVIDNELYTREDLLTLYNFKLAGVEPEDIFVQKEIGFFPAAKGKPQEFVARDVGDTQRFAPARDLVKQEVTGETCRTPTVVAKTKIFEGREKWRQFKMVSDLTKAVQTFALPGTGLGQLLLQGGASASLALQPNALNPAESDARVKNEARVKSDAGVKSATRAGKSSEAWF